VLDQADEVGNHGAVGGILVVGRLCDAAASIGALLSYFFRGA
jgi:hypothetical protein